MFRSARDQAAEAVAHALSEGYSPDSIGDPHLYRAHDWDFRGVPGDAHLGGGCGLGVGYYAVDASQLGLKPDDGFNVVGVLGPKGDTSRSLHLQRPAGARDGAAGARS
jgi:hypothetical protein